MPLHGEVVLQRLAATEAFERGVGLPLQLVVLPPLEARRAVDGVFEELGALLLVLLFGRENHLEKNRRFLYHLVKIGAVIGAEPFRS